MSRVSRDDLNRIFKNLDKNNDGLVSVQQLHHLLRQIQIHTSLEELESFVGGPTLDYIDFLFFYETMIKSGTPSPSPPPPPPSSSSKGQTHDYYEHDLVGAFKVFDLNGDGYISSEELQSVLSRLGLWDGTTGRDCRDMIRVYDENHDGVLDFEEFKNMMSVNNH